MSISVYTFTIMIRKCNNFVDDKPINATHVELAISSSNAVKRIFGPKELSPITNIVRG